MSEIKDSLLFYTYENVKVEDLDICFEFSYIQPMINNDPDEKNLEGVQKTKSIKRKPLGSVIFPIVLSKLDN